MARSGRRESRTGFHHIILRGNENLNLFESERDRREFWYIIDSKLEELPDLELVCSYLGRNHFHGIVHTNCLGMSNFCSKVASSYAKTYNLERERKGSVFQGRFLSEPIEEEEKYFKVERYLLLHGNQKNPFLFHIEDNQQKDLYRDPVVLDIPEDLYRQRKCIFLQIAKTQMREWGLTSLQELKQEEEILYKIQKEAKRIIGNTRDFPRILEEFLQ